MYNEVLGLGLSEGVGFAHDLAIVTTARYKTEIGLNTIIAVKCVHKWIKEYCLELVNRKTNIVLVSGKRSIEEIRLNVGLA